MRWPAFLLLLTVGIGGCAAEQVSAKAAGGGPGIGGGRDRTDLESAKPEVAGRVRACVPGEPEVCGNALDDDCNGLIDEGCGIKSGLVQFVAAWREPAVDVDLNVYDPNGELIEVDRISDSGLTKERDCPGRDNDCVHNWENVFLDNEAELLRGLYKVRIKLEKLAGAEPPIVVTVGGRVGPKVFSAEVRLFKEEQQHELRWRL